MKQSILKVIRNLTYIEISLGKPQLTTPLKFLMIDPCKQWSHDTWNHTGLILKCNLQWQKQENIEYIGKSKDGNQIIQIIIAMENK